MRRARRGLVLGCALALALAGCAAPEYVAAGPWIPQLQGAAPEAAPPTDPLLPAPPPPTDPGGPTPTPAPGAADPNVVASGLDTPWGLALLPDGSALVGERRTGRILQVFPDHAPVREVMTITGIDPSGDGGLLGLALSPAYDEDGLVYAYVSTPTDNRILRFALGGTPQAIATGIPHGITGNGGRIAFGPGEALYVGTGDAGLPASAADPANLAGKVLRLDIFGRPAPGNPLPGSPVFTVGNSDVTGLCFDGADRLYTTETGQPAGDELNLVAPGADYGWPDTPGEPAAETYPVGGGGLGGCAVLAGTAFVGSLESRQIWMSVLGADGSAVADPEPFLTGTYGRLRTVVADPAGALWVTTSNRDDPGAAPAADDDRVLRVLPPAGSGGGIT